MGRPCLHETDTRPVRECVHVLAAEAPAAIARDGATPFVTDGQAAAIAVLSVPRAG